MTTPKTVTSVPLQGAWAARAAARAQQTETPEPEPEERLHWSTIDALCAMCGCRGCFDELCDDDEMLQWPALCIRWICARKDIKEQHVDGIRAHLHSENDCRYDECKRDLLARPRGLLKLKNHIAKRTVYDDDWGVHNPHSDCSFMQFSDDDCSDDCAYCHPYCGDTCDCDCHRCDCHTRRPRDRLCNRNTCNCDCHRGIGLFA